MARGSYDKAHRLDNWLYQLVIVILAKITWKSVPPSRSGLLDGRRWSIVKGLWCWLSLIDHDGVTMSYRKVLVGAVKNLKLTLICQCEWSSHGVVPDENEFTRCWGIYEFISCCHEGVYFSQAILWQRSWTKGVVRFETVLRELSKYSPGSERSVPKTSLVGE